MAGINGYITEADLRAATYIRNLRGVSSRVSCWVQSPSDGFRAAYRKSLINFIKGSKYADQYKRRHSNPKITKMSWDTDRLNQEANRLLDIAARNDPRLVVKPLLTASGIDLNSPDMKAKAAASRREKTAKRKHIYQKPLEKKLLNCQISSTVKSLTPSEKVTNVTPRASRGEATGTCNAILQSGLLAGQQCGYKTYNNSPVCGMHDPQRARRAAQSRTANVDIALVKISDKAQGITREMPKRSTPKGSSAKPKRASNPKKSANDGPKCNALIVNKKSAKYNQPCGRAAREGDTVCFSHSRENLERLARERQKRATLRPKVSSQAARPVSNYQESRFGSVGMQPIDTASNEYLPPVGGSMDDNTTNPY